MFNSSILYNVSGSQPFCAQWNTKHCNDLHILIVRVYYKTTTLISKNYAIKNTYNKYVF